MKTPVRWVLNKESVVDLGFLRAFSPQWKPWRETRQCGDDVQCNIAVKEVVVPKDARSWKLRAKALMPKREKLSVLTSGRL